MFISVVYGLGAPSGTVGAVTGPPASVVSPGTVPVVESGPGVCVQPQQQRARQRVRTTHISLLNIMEASLCKKCIFRSVITRLEY